MSGWKYAFSLSNEDVDNANPLGTADLIDRRDAELEDGKGTSRSHQLEVAHPIRSADPADPLNWPAWRKAAVLSIASLYAFVANFVSASPAPALQIWNRTFREQRSYPELTYFIAVNVLFLGASNILWVPLSNWMGRRPVLLVATLVMTLCTAWCGLARSYDSLLAARIFQGIGAGAADTVAPALIGDVFFMDHRGRAMAVYTVSLTIGPIVGGISGGYIAYQLGWAYIFWVGTALAAACFIGVALLMPETLYIGAQEHPSTRAYQPFTFAQGLGFGPLHGNLLRHFVQPWKSLALPGTWVVMLHYAGLIGGIVTVSIVGPQLVAMPPYLWQSNAGLINVGGLVGAAIGYGYTHFLSDSRLQARAKHGGRRVAEPEDRLPTMFLPLAVTTGGFFVFGFCAQHPGQNRWVGLEVGYGMLAFGLAQIPSIGFNYLIDSYSHLAADCFVSVTILRSVIAFAWTFFVSHWVEVRGAAEPFGIFGMLMGLFSLTAVPLWWYGKRMRIATALHFKT